MHLFLRSLPVLLVTTICSAQDSVLFAPKNQWFLKISPLAVFETEGGIGLSLEYVLPKQKLGFQLEVQPLFFTVAKNGYKYDEPKNITDPGSPGGIKLRSEIRHYTKGIHSEPYFLKRITGFTGTVLWPEEPVRVYVAADLMYKFVRYNRTDDLYFNNPAAIPYTELKQVFGFDLKVGSISQSFPNKRWWAEAYAGIGARYKRIRYQNIPPGTIPPDRYVNLFVYRNTYPASRSARFGISIPMGVRLVYNL